MRKAVLAAAVSAMVAGAGDARAQEWPTRPVTLVVPYAAGGPADLMARILTQRLSEILGTQVIVENVGGAGGMNGVARVAKAAADGYQFVLGDSGTFAANQNSIRSLSTTPQRILRLWRLLSCNRWYFLLARISQPAICKNLSLK